MDNFIEIPCRGIHIVRTTGGHPSAGCEIRGGFHHIIKAGVVVPCAVQIGERPATVLKRRNIADNGCSSTSLV
ncbi:hypothetical protein PDESU_01845 [Pontiella desulfatans]|uniref:Uncharacterized protein n=1 Tax=Pontiella desulfatans TaxID=2750659 RepID=A0A6C2U0E4_PONDE|nr:hypothetical protein PDESU_01845 [Pontiella desulfatans]